jgi:Leucine-rich repeat (LRR) protein
MKHLIIVMALILSAGQSKAQQHLELYKTIADAIAVKYALEALNRNNENPAIKNIEEQISEKLDTLSQLETGFYYYSLPITLHIQDEHSAKILRIQDDLSDLMKTMRDMAKIAINQFEIDRYPIIQTFLSTNPGDYYTAVNPSFSYNLNNHPLREKIEEICLQDIGFEMELAAGDSSLWNMWAHCPNLKRIHLFGAQLTSAALARMHLHKIKKLTMIDLSENQIYRIPEKFNEHNTLIYLDLSKNNLTSLGEGYPTWTSLRYLNLKQNSITDDEIEAISTALPEVKIIF